MTRITSPSYSITIRVELENRIGMFALLATAISNAGGDLGSIDIVRTEKGKVVRDITANARDEEHEKRIVKAIRNISGLKVLRVMARRFNGHEGGKIAGGPKISGRNRDGRSKV